MARALDARVSRLEQLSGGDEVICVTHEAGDGELLGIDCHGRFYPRATDEVEADCFERVKRLVAPVNGIVHFLPRRAP